jgi:hypothetical protein
MLDLRDAKVATCIGCGRYVLAWSPSLQFCDACKKEKDRKRALDRYYQKKLDAGLPLHSPMGRPRAPDAVMVVDHQYVYDAEKIDGSNRAYKITCKEGHPLYGENLYEDPSGRRVCRTCHRNALREYRTPEPIPVPEPVKEPKPKGRPRVSAEEKEARERERLRRKAEMDAPVAELWPYGADDPIIRAIAAYLPQSIPDWVRADAGQEVYLRCLDGQVHEGALREAVHAAIKSAWGEYAISLDWRREDGMSLAERLEAPHG